MKKDEILDIGIQVIKKSGKPFKSKLKVNTISGYMVHPVTGRDCYLFIEDETYVECKQCVVSSAG